MLNRHSILFKLNIIFIFAILSTSIIFFALHDFLGKKSYIDLEFSLKGVQRALKLYSKEGDNNDLNHYLSSINLEIVSTNSKDIQKKAQNLGKDFLHEHNKPPFFFERDLKKEQNLVFQRPPNNFKILRYQDSLYIQLDEKTHNYLLKYNDQSSEQTLLLFESSYMLFMTFFIVLYFTIRKSISSLKILQTSLSEYGNGVVDRTKIIKGKDEVALLSKEFYTVASKLEALNKTKKLFLRNMMHELKTPLTKSKLYLNLMEESKMRDNVENSLQRLEHLIDDMANIEKISSENIKIEKKPYRLIDIIDNAIDILFIEREDIFINDIDCHIDADFALFTIVLKNLIDNGLKYSKNSFVGIECSNKKLYVSSQGEKLSYDFQEYLEPFFKGNLNEVNQKGFGLGLYIVNEIVVKHNFKFSYKYEDNKNIFIVDFSN